MDTPRFFLFAIFAFMLTLLMMNLLIAIMSEIVGKVHENSQAADSRSLAEMLYEVENFVYFFRQTIFRRPERNSYFYCFMTEVLAVKGEQEVD